MPVKAPLRNLPHTALLVLATWGLAGCAGHDIRIDQDADGWSADEDCDDLDAAVYPGATEFCNEADDDCDGEVDEGVTTTFYFDEDGDGYGGSEAIEACKGGDGLVTNAVDCDDTREDVEPYALEVCDGVDNNCDGRVDEGVTTTFYVDGDGDGYGVSDQAMQRCEQGAGEATVGGDCDDGDPEVHPGAVERCDHRDEDCDGYVDDGFDLDNDGYLDAALCAWGDDCDDRDPTANPGQWEVCGDGVDNDCDGEADEIIGEVFVTERSSGVLWGLDPAGVASAWTLGGLGQLAGVAVTPSGTVYVAQHGRGVIAEVPCSRRGENEVARLVGASGVWFDVETRTLLVTDGDGGAVYDIDLSTGTVSGVVSGLGDATMAVRRPGEDELFISDRDMGVWAHDPSTGCTELLTDVMEPNWLLLGEEGSLYVTTDKGRLYEVRTETGKTTLLRGSVGQAAGMCWDSAGGGILVATGDYGTVARYDLDTDEVTTYSELTSAPWDCAVHMPADGDGDGYYSFFYGGLDCDDEDASVYPGSGC